MENASMEELLRMHSSAKKKMILGIVFLAVGLGILIVGAILFTAGAYVTIAATRGTYTDDILTASILYVAAVFFSLPFFGAGVPLLIVGIVGRVKANRRINALRAQSDFT